jgi:hypothetical protein
LSGDETGEDTSMMSSIKAAYMLWHKRCCSPAQRLQPQGWRIPSAYWEFSALGFGRLTSLGKEGWLFGHT